MVGEGGRDGDYIVYYITIIYHYYLYKCANDGENIMSSGTSTINNFEM